jgi:ABC-2 type transport system ATP-binding protein
MSANVIQATAVCVHYGKFEAVRGVDLDVTAGEVVAVLGPNGAGKTSLIETLEGYRRPSGGAVRVLGVDPATGGKAFRDRIGIVHQEAGMLDDLTVEETVTAWRRFYSRPSDGARAIERVGLADRSRVRVRDLSGGERRRLDIALGTIGRPEVLFLDEPTTGLDPGGRRESWHLVRQMARDGTTIVLTSHYMDEVEALADRVLVMRQGQVIAHGAPGSIGVRGQSRVVSFTLPEGASPADLPPVAATEKVVTGRKVTLITDNATAAVQVLSTWAVSRGVELPDLNVNTPSLEDSYLSLFGAAPAPASNI